MKAKINLKNIYKFIESFFQKTFARRHIKEQVIYRTVLAKECVLNGECKFCGCSMDGTFDKRYSTSACNKKYENLPYCYDEFLNKKDWNNLKSNLVWNWFLEEAKKIENERNRLRTNRSSL